MLTSWFDRLSEASKCEATEKSAISGNYLAVFPVSRTTTQGEIIQVYSRYRKLWRFDQILSLWIEECA